jgi:hypothetical protein
MSILSVGGSYRGNHLTVIMIMILEDTQLGKGGHGICGIAGADSDQSVL